MATPPLPRAKTLGAIRPKDALSLGLGSPKRMASKVRGRIKHDRQGQWSVRVLDLERTGDPSAQQSHKRGLALPDEDPDDAFDAEVLKERTKRMEQRARTRARDKQLAKVSFRGLARWWKQYRRPIVLRDETKTVCDNLFFPSRYLMKLKKIFDTIDVDQSQHIDQWEFLDFVREPKTKFSLGFFADIDLNGDGTYVHSLQLDICNTVKAGCSY
jgi:hypothetical protein